MGSSIDRFLQSPPTTEPTPGKATGFSRWLSGADDDAKLGLAVKAGQAEPADRAARVLRLQATTGLPQDLLTRNLDAVEREAKRADFDPAKFRRESPIVASWLAEDPLHVSIAGEDLTKLGYLERQLRNIKDQFRQGLATTELTTIGQDAMLGRITPEQRRRQAELERQSTQAADYGLTGFFEGIPGALANQIPIFAQTLGGKVLGAGAGAVAGAGVGAVSGAIAGATAAAVAGQAGPQVALPEEIVTVPATGAAGAAVGAAAGARTGAVLGWRYGAAVAAARMEGSLAYLEYEKIKDENGTPLDRKLMVGAATVTGVLNGALEMVGFESLMKTVPGLRALGKSELKALLMNQTTRQALTHFFTSMGEAMLTEGSTEFLQDVVKNAAGELAPIIQDGSINKLSTGAILGRIFNDAHMAEAYADAKAGAQAGVGSASTAGVVALHGDLRRARAAENTRQAFEQIGATVRDAKLTAAMPEKMQEVVERLTKDGPAETVYAPIDAWNTYWQSKNADPAAVAQEILGSREAYDEAVRTGADLAIPTSKYAATIAPSEHNTFFADELRANPLEMNFREAKAFVAQLDAADQATSATESKATTGGREVAAEVTKQLEAAGFEASTAATYAQVYEAAFRTMGERAGVDPVELFKKYGLQVRRQDEAAGPMRTYSEIAADLTKAEERRSLARKLGQPDEARRVTDQIVELEAELKRVAPLRVNESAAAAERSNLLSALNETEQQLKAAVTPEDVNRLTSQQIALNAQLKALNERATELMQGERVAIDTPEFKSWFGASIVKSTEGTPLTVYHGTPAAGKIATFHAPAYFTDERSFADMFATEQGTKGTIYPVHLRLEHPYVIDGAVEGRHFEWSAADVKRMKAEGYDGVWVKGGPGESDIYTVFDPSQVKSATENSGAFNPRTSNIYRQESAPLPETVKVGRTSVPTTNSDGAPLALTVKAVKAFWKWFKGSKVVDEDGHPIMLYHGTVSDFDVFDPGKANPESDWGAGIYFTNTQEDVSSNYSGEGPDLSQKIELRSERIQDDLAAELGHEPRYGSPEYIALRQQALDLARQEFKQHEGAVMPVYVALKNPIVLGGDNETVLTYELVEDPETGDITDEKGTLVDFIAALRNVASHYDDGSTDEVISEIAGNAEDVTAARVYELLTGDEKFGYYQDKNGTLVSHEIMRRAFEEIGFDGVIDNNVDQKFGSQRRVGGKMRGMNDLTVHYIAFKPEQVKSAIGNRGTFDAANANILYQSPARTSAFYSMLATQIETAKLTAAPADQWQAFVKSLSTKGVKAEEVLWSGLTDWLALQSGKVTKQDVLAYLNNHGPIVVTKVLDGEATWDISSGEWQDDVPDADYFEETARELYLDDIKQDIAERDGIELSEVDPADAMPEAVERAEAAYWSDPDRAQWKSITLTFDGTDHDYIVNYSGNEIDIWRKDGEGESIYQGRALDHAAIEAKIREDVEELTGVGNFDDAGPQFANENYKEPGGENYRELLITVPDRALAVGQGKPRTGYAQTRTPDRFTEGHYSQPNVLAHVRMDDRVVDGKKVLFVEEIQSDWAQKGRDRGFKTATDADLARYRSLDMQIKRIESEIYLLRREGTPEIIAAEKKNRYMSDEQRLASFERVSAPLETELQFLRPEYAQLGEKLRGLPRGPFVQKTEAWVALAMKQIIAQAVERGADRVAWTTGDQQNRRWSLSKVVRNISWGTATGPTEDRIVHMQVRRGNNIEVRVRPDGIIGPIGQYSTGTGLDGHHITEVVGDAIGQKILAEKDGDVGANALEVGGDGMRAFYDRIAVQVANDVLKRVNGPKVTTFDLGFRDRSVSSEEEIPDGRPVGVTEKRGHWTIELENSDVTWGLYSSQAQAETQLARLQADYAERIILQPGFDITPELREAVLGKGFALFQPTIDGPRGALRFGTDRQFNIDLFKTADLSTFLHETGHFYLEVLHDLAAREDAPPTMRADLATVRAWLGAEGTAPLTIAQHEQFARGFEAYLMEGKAPTSALRSTFARFRAWLISVYRQIAGLNVQVTDDVRHVLDRMLATDDEIRAAEAEQGMAPLFTDPAAVGMNQGDAARYNDAVREAREAAEQELSSKLMADVTREQRAWWKRERAVVRTEVVAEVNADPVQIALAVLQKGTLPDGSPLPEGMQAMKLSKAAIVNHYGDTKALADFLKRLPRPALYAVDGGVHPDAAAGVFGFASGDALLNALAGAERYGRLVERLTDERMQERHGDLLTDGRLPVEAMKAVHTEKRAQLLRAELQHLASNNLPALKGLIRGVTRRVPMLEVVRQQAQDAIARKKVREINPLLYQRAEASAAREAVAALLRGDVEQAFEEKQRELLNHELYRAATAARDEAEQIARYMASFDESKVRERLGKAGADYLQQVDAIRARFDFSRVSLTALDRRVSLLEWVREQEAQGLEVSVPAKLLNEAYRQNYKDVTLEELRGIHDSVLMIAHLARLKNTLLANKKARTLAQARDEILAGIQAHHDIAAEPPDFAPGLLKRGKQWAGEGVAAHTRMEFLFEYLDGEGLGPVWDHLFKPLADAENVENDLTHESVQKLNTIFAAYSRAERATWFYRKVTIPGIVKTQFTKANPLAIALNVGNDYNRSALLEGYQWTEAQLDALLSTLDERDWKVVQGVWDFLESYWPQIAQMEKDLNGIAPEQVQARAVSTKFGIFKGGYYPIVFDSKLSWRQFALDEKANVTEAFGGNWARAMTKHGHTIERTNTGGKPLRLELTGLTNHVSNVVHDLAFRRAVIDVYRVMNDDQVRQAIEGAAGRTMYRQLRPWLLAIAGDRRGEPANPIEAILSQARSGATVVALGLKVTSGLVQTLGFWNTVEMIGPKYSLAGVRDMFRHPTKLAETWHFITDRSAMMRSRLDNYDRDVRDAMKQLNVAGIKAGPLSVVDAYANDVRHAFFAFIGFMDVATAVPTWFGAYRQAMDGATQGIVKGDEAAAIDYADSVVRKTQSAGAAKDLAAIQRGSESFKLFTMFYSQLSLQFNLFARAVGMQRQQRNIPRLIASMALLWFVPAALEDAIRGRTPGPDDDKDVWLKWLLRKELMYPFGTVVLLRDVATSLDRYLESGQVDYTGSPAFDAIESAVRALATAGKPLSGEEPSRADVKGLVQAIGYSLKLPSRQVWLTAEYFYDWFTGEQEPGNPAEGLWRALIAGKPRD